MVAFRTRGATGQAPTTVWFGEVPDRLNMLYPYHWGTAGNPTWDSWTVANNINQWSIFNTSYDGGANQNTVSLGAMTTAPDGNNTSQKIVESNVNSGHYLQAGYNSRAAAVFPDGGSAFTMRLAVFAKAAERSRIVLKIFTNGSASSGCKTVFDLAGGQIGVANAAFGAVPGWIAGPASIVPYGNGWYLCQMDATIGTTVFTSVVLSNFHIDAGTGTSAENSSYAGNGTSGVYTWRSVMLPPRAWSINTRTFFDDFNDNAMGNIDLTDSRAPGFNWYLHRPWPSAGWFTTPGFGTGATDPTRLSCSSSILTISPGDHVAPYMQTAAWDGGTGFVGKVFPVGGLYEAKMAYAMQNYDAILDQNASGAFWITSIEGLLTPGAAVESTTALEVENDFNEFGSVAGLNYGHHATFYHWINESTIGQGYAFNGYPIWYSARKYFYPNDYPVFYGGVVYTSLTSPNQGNIPSSSPSDWAVFDPTSVHLPATSVGFDATQQHLYSCLWLPYKKGDCGWNIYFLDGAYINGTPSDIPYGPNVLPGSNAAQLYTADSCRFPLFLWGAATANIALPPFSFSIDYVSVMQ